MRRIKRIPKIRNRDWKKTLCRIVLSIMFLGGMAECAMPAYGFDAVESYDTGGFDMDIGEGAGEIPGNWDAADKREDSSIDTGGNAIGTDDDIPGTVGGTDADGSSDTGNERWDNFSENGWQDNNTSWDYGRDTAERYEYHGNNGANENEATETATVEKQNERSDNNTNANNSRQSDNSQNAINIEIPEQGNAIPEEQIVLPTVFNTPKPRISFTPKPTFSPKPTKKLTATPKAPHKTKDQEADKQKLALSYYQTDERIASSSETQKKEEKCPVFHAEIHEDRISIHIQGNDPVQILSFRLNGKECNWCWQGKVLQTEAPKGTGKNLKAELLVYVRSGKLYHKILRLR